MRKFLKLIATDIPTAISIRHVSNKTIQNDDQIQYLDIQTQIEKMQEKNLRLGNAVNAGKTQILFLNDSMGSQDSEVLSYSGTK